MPATIYDSAVGPLTIIVNDEGALELLHLRARDVELRESEGTRRVVRQLEEYFAGKRTEFDLELAPRGTSFQLDVWNELQRIPYGTTISYSELAHRIARPNAVRAVGAANGANPIAIIIPCHRVIGANGSLTGYGGGLPMKKALLALEHPQRSVPLW